MLLFVGLASLVYLAGNEGGERDNGNNGAYVRYKTFGGAVRLVFFFYYLFIDLNISLKSISNKEVQLEKKKQKSRGMFSPSPSTISSSLRSPSSPPVSMRIAAVADLDKRSKISSSSWQSVLLPGVLTYSGRNADGEPYGVKWDDDGYSVTTKHNEGGRGMELSELTLYDGRLLSFGDRTGIIYEFIRRGEGEEGGGIVSVPRFILSEGSGESDKGMKVEWATVKGGMLYVGSFGKEFTNKEGEVVNNNNMWIVIIDHEGHVRRVDWSDVYNKVRSSVGCEPPGYLVHEAVLWSEHMSRWVFLPRRLSREKYDEVKDERLGSNVLISCDERFRNFKVVKVKLDDSGMDGLHGFSSMAFVPGSRDRHALALRSVEDNCTGDDDEVCKQRTYAVVFNVESGEVLMQEKIVSDQYKFEGVEFVIV